MDPRITQLTEAVTDGLKADRELRLEVQRELTAHLEETAAQCVAAGETEEAGIDHALRAFGPPAEVATGLATANRRRMKLRALVRLWLGTLIVPVAVIALLVVVYSTIYPLFTAVAGIDARPPLAVLESKGAREARLRSARLRDITQYRTLWEESRDIPAGKHYFAIYATYLNPLQTSAGAQGKYGVRLPAGRTFEQEMRLGMQIDPDNAFYHYYLARYYFHQGVQVRESNPKNTTPRSPKDAGDTVFDRKMLQRGIDEFKIGLAKPYLRTYRQDVLRERIALLPSRNAEQVVRIIGMLMTTTTPEDKQYRELTQDVGAAMCVLAAEGRIRETEPLLQAWSVMGRQLITEASTVREALAADIITQRLAKSTAAIYQQSGHPEQGTAVLTSMNRAVASLEKIRKRTKHSIKGDPLEHYGSATAYILAVDGATPEPTRAQKLAAAQVEGTIIERVMVLAIPFGMVLAMLVFLVDHLADSAKARKQKDPLPLLLLPPWPVFARIIGYGMLLPLALYFIVVAMTGARGDAGLPAALLNIEEIIDIPLLACCLIAIPMGMISFYLMRRCAQLGIPVPTMAEQRRMYRLNGLCLGMAIVGIACSTAVFGRFVRGDEMSWKALLGLFTFIPAIVVVVIASKDWKVWLQQYRLFCTAHSRLLFPIYGLVVLLLATIPGLYFRGVEQYWLKRNTLIMAQDGTLLPTKQPALEAMRAEMLKELDDFAPQRNK